MIDKIESVISDEDIEVWCAWCHALLPPKEPKNCDHIWVTNTNPLPAHAFKCSKCGTTKA